jgi:hypothetical protein
VLYCGALHVSPLPASRRMQQNPLLTHSNLSLDIVPRGYYSRNTGDIYGISQAE